MKLKNVEDIYPLSPMQQGMLFHSLYAPDSGQYFQQVSCTLEGELHIPTFELAWQRVAQRYPALRTAFFWEGLQEPLQVVRQQLAIDFRHYDWREFLGSDRQEKLERLLQTDLQSGFHLAQAPLMRFHLIRHQEQSYRLIWSYHHILLDGWCLSPILNDVFSLYDALCRGDNLHLPSVRPYRDYIQWLQQQETTSSERFWTNYLADFNAPTPLPHCGKQGVFQEEQPGPAYQEQQFQVSQDITRRLQRLAQQQRATLNVIMQAAWAILLSRYSGETDVVFGATVSGRPAALTGVEGMVGLFINTLPIRIQLASDLSLNALLQQIQARQFDVESYSYTALVDIQGWSDLPSGAALFESLLLFENFPVEKMAQGRNGLRVKDFRFDERTNYPLTIMIEPGAELSIKVSYDRSRFDAATITRMLQHVHVLLASIATHPERPVSRLPLLTDAEQRQLVTEWNQTKTEYPADSCFYHLFEDRAKQFPGALAVICDDERLTYQELNTRANQLAHYLRTLQIGPDTLVGLCLERSPDMIVGLLGILKAGGAYVPLDPAFPEDRLAYMLEDAGVSVLVTQESLQSKFHVPHRLCLDRDWDIISQERQDNPMNGAISDNLAYVIYTSGSTGKPKGVQIGHQSLVNFLHSMRVEPGLTNQDCLLAVTTISFDIAALELYLPLITGAGIILASREQATDGLQLAQLLTHNDVTVMQATPATWRMLLAAGWEGNQNLKILCGGEALPKDLSKALLARGASVWNLYGPTETTIWSAVYQVTDGQGADNQNLPEPIGRPINNTQIYILDRHLQPVPVGVAGELYIGGDGLAKGYLHRPELTAAKFIADPFRDKPDAHLYRVGDLARYLPDGNIEFLGRTDFQVKIRGFRIELGEIEAVLADHPSLREAVVIVREDRPGDKQLVAYIVTGNQSSVDSSRSSLNTECRSLMTDLREHLKQSLPDYMIPSYFVSLDALPLTPNKKIDRLALPAPMSIDSRQATSDNPIVAPQDEVERALAGIWQDVLGIENIGIQNNFFDLGGHSLKATVLMSRIHKELQVKTTLQDIFKLPTIELLARRIRSSDPSTFIPIEKIADAEHYPLSHAQRRLWVLHQMDSESGAYNMAGVFLLKGEVDRTAFEKTWAALFARHESLRTVFIVVDGKPRQKIMPISDFEIKFQNLTQETLPRDRAQELIREDETIPFDLANGPLLRVSLFKIADAECMMTITMHHIISDEWSVGILMQEAVQLSEAFRKGQDNPLPSLHIQYRDYSEWQNRLLASEEIEPSRKYWQTKLGGELPILNLPTDLPRPLVQTFNGEVLSCFLSADLTERLRSFTQQRDVTLFMMLVALVKVLIYRYTGQEDIITGSPIAGRNHADLERQIGFYANTLTLRDRVQGEHSFERFLQQVKHTATEAYDHQFYPFDLLVEKLNLARDLSHSPLFDVMVELQNIDEVDLSLDGLDIYPLEQEYHTSKFDLTFSFKESSTGNSNHSSPMAGLRMEIEYNTDLFLKERIKRMSSHLTSMLESILHDPDQPVSKLPFLTETEQDELLRAGKGPQRSYPVQKTLSQLFEEQVEAGSERIAMIHGDDRITYAALNARANRIAHLLRRVGVGRNDIVGILQERGFDFLAAMLGILKAGGAYLPIDPDYPEDRIQYMVTNSLIRTLITNSALMEKFLFNGMLNSRLRNDDSSWRLNTILCLDSAVNAASFKQHGFDVYDHEGLTDEATTNPTPLATCRDRAYMLYTSGSTGAPKGAIIRHDGKINHIYAQIDALHLHRDTAFLQSAPTSSDISVWQFLAPVLLGGCTVIVDRDIVCDPGALFNEIHSRQVTSIELVPVVLQEFLRYIAQLPPEKRALPALERAMVTGEAVSVALVNHWWQMYPEIPLINAYGPTEAADDTSQWEMDAALPDTAHSVPIGKTLANLTNYILDRHFQLQPFGVPGEICVAGIGVGEGYWQNEEKTRESFVKNPYSTHTYDRVLYRTGDVGRWLPDGNLEFSGRIDQQVKIRGYRMELGEIEHQLLNHKGVREAAVLVRAMDKDNPLAKSLIAYVIGAAELTVAVLRDYLKTMLPEYMIPAYFVQLDEFPLTPNDKIDKKALPTPDEAGMRQGTSYEAPRNSGEELLASVLAEILGMQQVGINENYFALGGDSIKAIQFVSRLSQQGMKLEMRDIFQYPTVAELAFRMTAMKPKTIELDVKGTIPFTAIQQEFFREIHVDRHHHNQAVLLRGKPRLDENVLRTALTAMLHHHETLWLCFGTTIRQRYPESPPPLSFEVFDLQGSEDSEAAMGSHIDKLHASLNLELGELMKTALFRLDDSDRLFITIHHLVVDGVSWRILLEDLHSAYQSSIGPSTSPGRRNRQSTIQLPPKTASFKTWSEKIHEYSHSSEQEQEQAYWRQITSTPPLMLPSDLEGGTNLVQHSGMLSIDISEEETELLLREVHHAYNTQIDDILLTALAQAVQGWTGRQRIPVLLEGHGREPVVDVDVSRTVGWFTSMYPILLVLPDSDEPGRTIKEIKEILRKVPNKGIGYGILRYLAQDEAIVRNPWPEICFNYLGQFDDGAEGVYFATAAESSGQLISPAQEQLYALEIVGLVVENRFRLSVTYDGTRFQENTINRLLEMYHQALSVLTAHCRSKIEGEKTPGDFIYSDLSLDQFDAILEKFQ